jgi:hypothetical protein
MVNEEGDDAGRPPVLSVSAVSSIAAALASDPGTRTEAEGRYDEVVRTVVLKPGGHTVARWPELHGPEQPRLYTVTTIASSARYGGTRTPVICSSFERAHDMVTRNEGELWEYSYMLAVIEAIVPDRLYCNLEEQYWYVWRDGYVPIEVPEKYRQVCGFGIG